MTLKFLPNFAITRYQRIENYLKDLEDNIIIRNKNDKEVIANIDILIKEKIVLIRRATLLNSIFYFGVYFSFISLFFSEFFILSELADFVSKLISFFGTTVFIIGIFITNKILELYYEDLNLLVSHIISMYNKSQSFKLDIFNDANSYNMFIDFFKKRGF